MNPDWVELAKNDLADQIDTTLHMSKLSHIAIPSKLWKVIEATPGWFRLEALPQRTTAGAELG
jgi:hypothetical protein